MRHQGPPEGLTAEAVLRQGALRVHGGQAVRGCGHPDDLSGL